MPAEEQTALAKAASATLVSAMSSSVWHSVRPGIVRLFTCHDPDAAAPIEAQLDANFATIARAGDPEGVGRLLAGLWHLEFAGLLDRSPAAAGALATWAVAAQAALPGTSQAWTQTNTAHDHGVVNAVLHGNQYNQYMDSPPQ